MPEDSKKHVAALKSALKADDLILATDYDREGEAIAYHVARCSASTRRRRSA